MKSIFVLMLLLFSAEASAEEVRIRWKGEYPHNSSKHWSKDNPYDSGFSKNFKNGTPEEFGDLQKDGELNAFIYSPKNANGPAPFVILLHGCDGLGTLTKEWGQHVADVLNPQRIGVLVLDSFTTRYVDRTCGPADLHWGRRRADDAYSALDYLVEKKLAKADEVYLMGYSNGGTTTLVSMTTQGKQIIHTTLRRHSRLLQVAVRHCSIPRFIRGRLSSLWATKTMRIIQSGAKS